MSVATSTGSTSLAGAPTDLPVVYSNLGPLTTVFTGPPSCATREPLFSQIVDSHENLIAAQCDDSTFPSNALSNFFSCAPSSAALASIFSAQVSANGSEAYTTDYYSPGISCPSGYQTATSFTVASSQVTTSATNALLPVTGTHIICCPSSYAIYNTDYGYCLSTASAATTITDLCFNDCTMSETCPTASPFPYNPAAQPTVTVEAGIEAVYMVHQQSDVPSATATKTGGARTERVGFGAIVSMAMLAVFAVATCSL